MKGVEFTVYRPHGNKTVWIKFSREASSPTWVSNSWMATTTPYRREAESWASQFNGKVEKLEV